MPLARSAALLGATATVVAAAIGFQEARDGITADEIRAHLYFLSQDELGGRAPGTRGAELAAGYIKTQFLRMGLRPVDGSFFQNVPLVGTTIDPTTASLAFEVEGGRVAARYPEDAVFWPGLTEPSVQLEGELVFVGYGIEAPEWEWDDFDGRNLDGKVLVFLVGDPPAPPDEPDLFDGRAMTYYGRWSYKFEEARRRGAAGALIIHTDEAAGYGWGVVRSSWTGETYTLAGDRRGPPVLKGWLTRDLAARVFSEADVDLAELYVRAARRDFTPVATGITVRGRLSGRSREIDARNVVGYAPGAGPAGDEVVVFTAHYDHLGIGPPVDGDSIYNGAYDNASGVALLLEVAEAFAALDSLPRRTALFVATTAEEAGLLGARHYVRAPVFPIERTVAAFNIDGANLWGETDDVVALGAERSTLGALLRPRAMEMGLAIRPDPEPEKGAFFRSDHFAFALAGVPVLYLRHGLDYRGRPAGWGDRMMRRWAAESYHQPSDEYGPGIDLSGAVQQGRLVFSVGYDAATAETRPEWYDDAGARTAGGPPR